MSRVVKWLAVVEATIALQLAACLIRWGPLAMSRRIVLRSSRSDTLAFDLERWQGIAASRAGFLRALRASPVKIVCLPQALAARWMLNRRKIPNTLKIGFDSASDRPSHNLHAWLVVGGEVVLGGEVTRHVAMVTVGAEDQTAPRSTDKEKLGEVT